MTLVYLFWVCCCLLSLMISFTFAEKGGSERRQKMDLKIEAKKGGETVQEEVVVEEGGKMRMMKRKR